MKNSILAMDIQGYVKYVPAVIFAVGVAFLAFAFLFGFIKGGRKVHWGGVVWLFAFGTYYVVGKILGDSNPLLDSYSWKYDARVLAFVWDLVLVLTCIIAVLLIYGLLTLLFRPRPEKERGDNREKEGLEEFGFKYDDNDEYQDYKQYQEFLQYRQKQINNAKKKKKKKKTSFFGRVFGGIICAINAGMLLAVFYSAFLLIVDATALKTGFFAPIYGAGLVTGALPFVYKYALDMAIIGIILAITLKGRSMGVIEAIRTVLVKIGSPIALIIGCYLPFSPFAQSSFYINAIVTRSTGLFTSLGTGEMVANYGGKILSCILIVAVLVLAFWLLNLILKKLSEGVKKVLPFKAIDNALSSLVFMMLGVAVVVVIWGVSYLLSYYGLVNMHEIMLGETGLSRGLFETLDLFARPRLDAIMQYVESYTQGLPF